MVHGLGNTKIKKKKIRRKKDSNKIQSPQMERAIERTRDITEAYLHGGKAVGDIIKSKKKK